MGYELDMSKFSSGFADLVQNTIPGIAGDGLFAAGNELLSDAIYLSKTAPKDIGDLWASGRCDKAEVVDGAIEVKVGFNIEYAAYLHEGQRKDGTHVIKNWTRDKGSTDPGPKFLESKMMTNPGPAKYLAIVADFIKAKSESK